MKKLLAPLLALSLPASFLTTAAVGAVVSAPPAAAAGCDFASGQLCDGTQATIGQKPPPPPPPPPNCEENDSCPDYSGNTGTWTEETTYGGSLYFWDTNSLTFNDGRAGQFTLDYSGMHSANSCPNQKGFANAPLGGTRYNIRVGRWLVISQQKQQTVVDGQVQVAEFAPTMRWVTSCWDYTTPSVTPVELTSYGQLRFQGPFDNQGRPMRSEEEGGSLTRDSDGDGVPSVDGQMLRGVSDLGRAILEEEGFDPSDEDSWQALKTLTGSPATAYNIAIKTGSELNYLENTDEVLPDYGRYAALQSRWRPEAQAFVFSAYRQFLPQMYPAIVATRGTNFFPETSSLLPMYIPSVTGPNRRDDVQRIKLHCATSKTADGTMKYDRVSGPQPSNFSALEGSWATGMPRSVQVGEWGDSANGYYSYECGPPPDDPRTPRLNDLLVCDDYESIQTVAKRAPLTQPYTYRSETYQTGTQRYQTGTETYVARYETYSWTSLSSGGATYYWWVNGGRGGYACPGGWWLSGSTCYTWTTHYATRPVYATRATYGYRPTYGTRQVKNPAPAGYFDDGRRYVESNPPCPEGYTDSGNSTCSTTIVSDIIVDNKNAAPIDEVDERLEFVAGSTYNANAFADPYGTTWRRPAAQVNAGALKGLNVNDLPASSDTRWSREWRLAPESSPLLIKNSDGKDATVNDTEQPFHLFTDPTADSFDYPDAREQWVPARDNGTGSASLNKWVGLEKPGWEETQRTLIKRFYQSTTDGREGFRITPWWRITTTIPVEITQVIGFTASGDGLLTPITTSEEKDVRAEYDCPGQPITLNIERITTN